MMMDITGKQIFFNSLMLKQKLTTISTLIRIPNLAVIALTQVLLRYCILKPVLYTQAPELISGTFDFFILVLATVLTAAGGYIINNYFDISIDEINKPEKNPIGTITPKTDVFRAYWILNVIIVLLGFYLALRVKSWNLAVVFPFISALLWFYSTRYKRTLLLGNVIVSLLSALVILIVWYFEFLHFQMHPENFVPVLEHMKLTVSFFLIYSLFAFLVSLFREMIKDMEDVKGDELNGCRTLPIVIGIQNSRFVVAFLVLVVTFLVTYCSWIAWNLTYVGIMLYLLIILVIPLIYLLVKLFQAKESADFHFLSSLCKIIMVAGILTLQLISSVH